MFKAIIFDNGGVLHKDIRRKCNDYKNKKLGISYERAKDIFKDPSTKMSKGKINETEYWKEIFLKLNRKYDPSFVGLLYSAHKKYLKINKKVFNLASKLKRSGYRVAMLSDTSEPHVKLFKELRLFNNFNPRILSCKVGMKKPNKNIYLYTLKKLKLKAKECVFIDDLEINVKGAEKVGINAIHFKNYSQLVKDLKKLGVEV